MVYLLRTFDLWRIMGEVLIDREAKMEGTAFVHSLVRFDGEGEVEDIVGVGEFGLHGAPEGEF